MPPSNLCLAANPSFLPWYKSGPCQVKFGETICSRCGRRYSRRHMRAFRRMLCIVWTVNCVTASSWSHQDPQHLRIYYHCTHKFLFTTWPQWLLIGPNNCRLAGIIRSKLEDWCRWAEAPCGRCCKPEWEVVIGHCWGHFSILHNKIYASILHIGLM